MLEKKDFVYPPYTTVFCGLEDLAIEGTDKKYGAVVFTNGGSIALKTLILGKKDVFTGRYEKCSGNFVEKFMELRASAKSVAEFEDALEKEFKDKAITVEYGRTCSYYDYANRLAKGHVFVINYK